MYTDNCPQTSSPDEDSLYSVENIAIHIPKKNKQTNKQQNKTNNYTPIQCTQGWPVLWYSSLALKVYPYSWTWLLISTSYDLALQRPYIYLMYLSQRMDMWNIVKKKSLCNPFNPEINTHILHTVLYTFPKVLTRRICLIIKNFFNLWSFPLISWKNVWFGVW